jgi:copper resistance protein C
MKIKSIAIGSMLLVASAAQAHTHLESSIPADKSKVAAPVEIVLHFSEAAHVTAMTLQQGTSPAKALTPLPTKASQHVAVPVKGLVAGEYTVNWRVAGEDGHVMSGKFAFTVDPAAAPAKPAMQMPMHDHDATSEHKH